MCVSSIPDVFASIIPRKCGTLPAPAVPKFASFGFARAQATKPARSRAGWPEATASAYSNRATWATGARSFAGS
jgi:hypothetical protein